MYAKNAKVVMLSVFNYKKNVNAFCTHEKTDESG